MDKKGYWSNDMTPKEIVKQLLILKKDIEEKRTNVDTTELIENFLNNPGNIRFDADADNPETAAKIIEKSGSYKKIMLFAHPDKREGDDTISRAIEAYIYLNKKQRQAVFKLWEKQKISTSYEQKYKNPLHFWKKKGSYGHTHEAKQAADDASKHANGTFHANFLDLITKTDQNYEEKYKEATKKTGNWAQKIFPSIDKRANQSRLIERIRIAIDIHCRENKKEPGLKEAQLFYAALRGLQYELQSELRWTKWLGTQSRLEAIVKKDMQILEKQFPNGLQTTLKDLEESSAILLDPETRQSFLNSIKAARFSLNEISISNNKQVKP